MVRGAGPLLRTAHIEPSLAVTLAATALALGAGLRWRAALVALAVGAGQLSIGWSNDWLDHDRDTAVGRRDKPLAQGRIDPRTVALGAALALAVCATASFALGRTAGAVHLIAVGAGWGYNLRAKHTWYSVVPWALAFGLLPAVVTLTEPLGRWPAGWVMAAGALLGAGAHFANAVPDLEHDRATGVAGLPHRLGRRRSLAATLALVATGVVVVGAAATTTAVSVAILAVGATALGGVVVALRRGHDRAAFRGIVALLVLLAFGVVAGGTGVSVAGG